MARTSKASRMYRRRVPFTASVDRESLIAILAASGIAAHLVLRFAVEATPLVRDMPLFVVLAFGGIPLVLDLARKALRRQFGSDLLMPIV